MVGETAPQAGTLRACAALNQRLVLDRLGGHGEATRPQIADDTGLSKPTVGQALLDLETARPARVRSGGVQRDLAARRSSIKPP